MINDVVQILTHSFIFKGERGPQGSRGQPGEYGLKGAKVRGSHRGWVLAAGLSQHLHRNSYWCVHLLYTLTFAHPLPNQTRAECVVMKTHFQGSCVRAQAGLSSTMCCQIHISLSNSMWAGQSVIFNNVFLLNLFPPGRPRTTRTKRSARSTRGARS